MEIRKLREEDIELCRGIMDDNLLHHVFLGVENEKLEKRMMIAMRERMNGEWFYKGIRNFSHYVCCNGEKVVGMGAYENDEICRVYIDSSFKGQGIGSEIVEFVEDKMRKEGFDQSIAHAYNSSKDFWLKKGYKKSRIFSYDYPEHGFEIPTVEMVKIL